MTVMHEEKYQIPKSQAGKRYAEALRQRWEKEGRAVSVKETRQNYIVESLTYEKEEKA